MKKAKWQPDNHPSGYDADRVATLTPIHEAVDRLQLPPIRFRKIKAILNALDVQIEDGGDNPAVNQHLLDALRLAAIHQVGEQSAVAVLRAIDRFAGGEQTRWEQLQAGTLPPPPAEPDEELDDLIQAGYELLARHQTADACNRWLIAWERVQALATPAMSRVADFDDRYPGLLQSISNWSQDLELELHNAGVSNPVYHEHRIRYARDYLACFPDDDADRHVSFRRAEAEALWALGRQAEATAVYRELVKTFPDQAWGYIGWSDQYYMWRNAPADTKRAEAILRQALARPHLDDPRSVKDRLAHLIQQRKQARQSAKPNPSRNPKQRKGRGKKRRRK